MGKLTSFAIFGLWGERNYKLQFTDGNLIIVGENGTGKTTVLRILYNCLSRNWQRLKNEVFERIEICFDEDTRCLGYRDFEDSTIFESPKELFESLPLYARREIESPTELSIFEMNSILNAISPERNENSMVFYYQNIPDRVLEIANWIENNLECQIVYYPTYRRFEDNEKRTTEHFRRFRRGFGESVYFPNREISDSGMGKVNAKINNTIGEIELEYNRSSAQLNLSCFKGILTQDFADVVPIQDEASDPEYIETVFSSVIGSNFPAEDLELVKTRLLDILAKNSASTEYDKIVIYFYKMLVERYENLKAKADVLEAFFHVCNGYLNSKSFEYDASHFSYGIKVETHTGEKKPMDIQALSSGEKQMVAMMCYLYLPDDKKQIVIIDEPELSLSVDWQERILEDVKQGPMCSSIIVATQSPFVYDNSLRPYAHAIEEFLVLE